MDHTLGRSMHELYFDWAWSVWLVYACIDIELIQSPRDVNKVKQTGSHYIFVFISARLSYSRNFVEVIPLTETPSQREFHCLVDASTVVPIWTLSNRRPVLEVTGLHNFKSHVHITMYNWTGKHNLDMKVVDPEFQVTDRKCLARFEPKESVVFNFKRMNGSRLECYHVSISTISRARVRHSVVANAIQSEVQAMLVFADWPGITRYCWLER